MQFVAEKNFAEDTDILSGYVCRGSNTGKQKGNVVYWETQDKTEMGRMRVDT
jgi:hypothetical protein